MVIKKLPYTVYLPLHLYLEFQEPLQVMEDSEIMLHWEDIWKQQ